MLDRARLDQMEESGAAAAMKYRAELEKAVQAVKNDTSHAVKSYFDNVKEKRQAISRRVEALRAECKDLEEEVSSFGPKLARATISGDGSALESIQREIAELEANKAAAAAQIDLLSAVHVTGDEDLYRKASELAVKLEAVNREVLAALSALAVFAEKQVSLWREVMNFSSVGAAATLPASAILAEAEKMRQDFERAD